MAVHKLSMASISKVSPQLHVKTGVTYMHLFNLMTGNRGKNNLTNNKT